MVLAKMKSLSLFTRPHVVPNAHDFLIFCVTQRRHF